MNAILVVTLCLAFGQEAECRREFRVYERKDRCLEMKRPMRDYLEAMEQPRGAFLCTAGANGLAGIDTFGCFIFLSILHLRALECILKLSTFVFFCAAFSAGVLSRPYLSDLKAAVSDSAEGHQVSPRITQFAGMNSERYDLVMLGDSLTDHGRWSELMTLSVSNRGIGRDTVSMISARSDLLPPGPIYLMVGINDLSRGRSVKEIEEDFRVLLNSLKDRSVVVQSVLGPEGMKVSELNARLEVVARDFGAGYLDLTPYLGHPLRFTYDGIHLTAEGYRLWSDVIETDLLERQ